VCLQLSLEVSGTKLIEYVVEAKKSNMLFRAFEGALAPAVASGIPTALQRSRGGATRASSSEPALHLRGTASRRQGTPTHRSKLASLVVVDSATVDTAIVGAGLRGPGETSELLQPEPKRQRQRQRVGQLEKKRQPQSVLQPPEPAHQRVHPLERETDVSVLAEITRDCVSVRHVSCVSHMCSPHLVIFHHLSMSNSNML
jgi:hypothetical protein